MEFLGIKGVVDAEAIIGRDGCADGFRVIYENGGKVCSRDVYVREFDWNSVGCDGRVHGFGKPVMYLRSNPSYRKSVKERAMLARVREVLGR